MLPRPLDVSAPDPADLRDKALNLRESVNSSRARMRAQKERLEALRRDIAELRALVGQPPAPPAPATPISAPFVKEAAPVSAAATASFTRGAGYDSWKPVPYIAILFVAIGLQLRSERRAQARLPVPPPRAAPADGGADQALLLAHDWRLPGDERSLSERLSAETNPTGAAPEWTAQRTGERTYRVTFKPSGSEEGYDFDVDLAARRVNPTPETAELISPRLASSR